jgi:hypothetical protein
VSLTVDIHAHVIPQSIMSKAGPHGPEFELTESGAWRMRRGSLTVMLHAIAHGSYAAGGVAMILARRGSGCPIHAVAFKRRMSAARLPARHHPYPAPAAGCNVVRRPSAGAAPTKVG